MLKFTTMNKLLNITLYIFALLIISTQNANAYIDPGSGSYFFQMLVASLFGATYAVKLYWDKITSQIKKVFNNKKTISSKEDNAWKTIKLI